MHFANLKQHPENQMPFRIFSILKHILLLPRVVLSYIPGTVF